jgi:hypothetical protein
MRGQATFEGIAGTFDVIVSGVAGQQTGKASQEYETERITDVHGGEISTVARNEKMTLDVTLKFLGSSQAVAAAPLNGSVASLLGQPFLLPLQTVNLSGFAPLGSGTFSFNGQFRAMTGGDADLSNVKVGDFSLKLERFANAAQNTLLNTTPS